MKKLLKDALKAETGRVVRIGCLHGSGFVYVGRPEDADFEAINVQARKSMTKRKPRQNDMVLVKLFDDEMNSFIPIEDREVAEEYQSDVDDNRIYMVEGFGGGIQYEPEGSGADLDPEACMKMVVSIYKSECRELIYSYMGKRKEDHTREQEIWIRSDPYGILADPEGLIRACRMAAGTNAKIMNDYARLKKRGNQ